MKEILNVIHNTIYQFIDVCNDNEEVPMSDKDKLLLEVNKAICKNLKALEQEPAEWIVDTDDSRRWDRVRFYCSACNGWNTYGKSKYCPNCGRRMQSEGLQRENS